MNNIGDWKPIETAPAGESSIRNGGAHIHGANLPQYDVAMFIVLDDYGKNGKVYRETDEARADLDTVVTDIIEGQYDNPSRVVAFNTSEGWSRDVTEDVAREILERSQRSAEPLEGIARAFVEFATSERV